MTRDEWNAIRRHRYQLVNPPRSIEDKFWAHVESHDDNSDQCWIWIGARQSNYPYGVFNDGKRLHRAHRYSYILRFDEIPNGLWVLHKCDNPPCVNPDHLFLGTHQDNMDDQERKCRKPRGESDPRHKLTFAQVCQIRDLYKPHIYGAERLSKRFGVTTALIWGILKKRKRVSA